eukprot:1189264-Prorocentrum_minimum.AAC.3
MSSFQFAIERIVVVREIKDRTVEIAKRNARFESDREGEGRTVTAGFVRSRRTVTAGFVRSRRTVTAGFVRSRRTADSNRRLCTIQADGDCAARRSARRGEAERNQPTAAALASARPHFSFSRSSTRSTWPSCAATWSGVTPSSVGIPGSAPFASSAAAASVWPAYAAFASGSTTTNLTKPH